MSEQNSTDLITNENGTIELKTIREQMGYAKRLIENQLVSSTFKTPQQVFAAFQFLKSANLPPHLINGMYVINGKPCLYGNEFVAMAQRAGLMTHIDIIWFDESGVEISRPKKGIEYFGCEVTLGRKNVENKLKTFFTMDDKKKAGLTNPTWGKYPKDMLMRRALAMGIKILFADCLNGIEIYEAMDEVGPTSSDDVKNSMNEAFSE